MFTLKNFGTFAGVAVLASIGTNYMRHLLEEKIGKSEVCQKAIQVMKNDEKCMTILGRPVIVGLPNITKTKTSQTEVTTIMPVTGSRDKGKLQISAFKDDMTKSWKWKYIKVTNLKEKDDLVILSEEELQ